jgi:hypothetical protein
LYCHGSTLRLISRSCLASIQCRQGQCPSRQLGAG